ncbi:unnamed protein product [Lasius platythorax]|uniref:Uncharacterized protein n=1 Tax=Lasius platythorax TaxID=488582 RepID=A0AAV2NCW6_9HYME
MVPPSFRPDKINFLVAHYGGGRKSRVVRRKSEKGRRIRRRRKIECGEASGRKRGNVIPRAGGTMSSVRTRGVKPKLHRSWDPASPRSHDSDHKAP